MVRTRRWGPVTLDPVGTATVLRMTIESGKEMMDGCSSGMASGVTLLRDTLPRLGIAPAEASTTLIFQRLRAKCQVSRVDPVRMLPPSQPRSHADGGRRSCGAFFLPGVRNGWSVMLQPRLLGFSSSSPSPSIVLHALVSAGS